MAPRTAPREARKASDTVASDPADNERYEISKKITWLLRRGAATVGVDIDENGWVKIADLSNYVHLNGVSQGRLLQVINDSNTNKLRYEVKGAYVRAYEKAERRKMALDAAAAVTASAPPAAASAAPATINYQHFPAAPPVAAAAPMHPQMPYGYPSGYPAMNYAAPQPQQHPMVNPYMMPYMASAYQQDMAPQAGSGRHVGRIKSYNEQKGFGFIECDMTYYMYQRDVFLHRVQIGDLNVGQWVYFVCEQGKTGMPQAKEVYPCGGQAMPPAAPVYDGTSGKGKGKGQGQGKGQGKDQKSGKGKDQKGGKGKGEGKGQKKKDTREKVKEAIAVGQVEVAAA